VIKKRVSIIFFLGALLTIFATTASADTRDARQVSLTTGNETRLFHTHANTVGEFLESEEVHLNAKDLLNLGLDAELNIGEVTELLLRRSFTISIMIDENEAFEYEVGPTQRVGHIIAELREQKQADFRHSGFLSDAIAAGSTLYLRSVTIREHVMALTQPYETEVRMTWALAPNETQVLQEGVFGEIATVIRIAYVGGVEIDRTVVSVTQTRQPVSEIVIKGNTSEVPQTALPRGTIMSLNGTVGNDYAYTISKIMESTAYSAQQPELSNYTASGHRAVRGVIAVDPNVIPLGTWVYVEGYGRALASDTGGAIRGYIIDLCFDTVAEAIQHGRRNVRVWILSDTFEL